MVKCLSKKNIKKDNKDLLNFNKIEQKKSRDLDWDGNSSAAYCNQWWGREFSIYNPAYINYASKGGDCANFSSQCLIAGYYDDIKAFLSFSIYGVLEKGFDSNIEK